MHQNLSVSSEFPSLIFNIEIQYPIIIIGIMVKVKFFYLSAEISKVIYEIKNDNTKCMKEFIVSRKKKLGYFFSLNDILQLINRPSFHSYAHLPLGHWPLDRYC